MDPFLALERRLGFLPNIFKAQASLSRAVAAEAGIADAVIFSPGTLGRKLKEMLLTAVAATRRNVYCTTVHAHFLTTLGIDESRVARIVAGAAPEGLDGPERSLFDFGLRLGLNPNAVNGSEIRRLQKSGLTDEQILEGILTVSLARFLCTLAEGLAPAPDFHPLEVGAEAKSAPSGQSGPNGHGEGPYIPPPVLAEEGFPPFEFFRRHFGFVPNIFRAQTLKPEVLEAEVEAIRSILLPEDLLSRRMKEYILLVVSARNLNTYCVAVHCELLRGLGVPFEVSDQIALDHRLAGLSPEESALLDFILRLQDDADRFGPADFEPLRKVGWSGEQILEAIVMSALSNFLNTLQCGLGTVPDFPVRVDFGNPSVNLSGPGAHPTARAPDPSPSTQDPDAPLVARARSGDLEAFERLVVSHQARVYRLLLGVTASPEEAEDGTQEVFVKAMGGLESFRGSARFTTWLTRIAINEGLERVRRRRRIGEVKEAAATEEPFRPRHVSPWTENPEELLSRREVRELVEREILALPFNYRSAVILRDIAQFSTPAAAQAMGLGVPTFKTRLLRGRLMLREALAPHFTRGAAGEKADVHL
jgi:RNA polymerase sigma-70 factor (ECF subfamily)